MSPRSVSHSSQAHRAAVFVDSHVHMHDCFDPARFLAAAHANFAVAAACREIEPWWGVLLLTESAGAGWFERLRHGEGVPGWRMQPSDEAQSLRAFGPADERLHIVAGLQIATAERLELLALGTTEAIPDGLALEETMRLAEAADAVRVIPWGFGKWLGGRGRLVRKLIDAAGPGELFLGDNSGRPRWAPEPAEFVLGSKKGLSVLPGTDPLPFRHQVDRVARYGLYVLGTLEETRAFDWVRKRISSEPAGTRPFGERERLAGFIRNQVAMQIRKHRS